MALILRFQGARYMTKGNRFKGLLRDSRFVGMILGLSFLGVGALTIIAIAKHMDIPALITSWTTKQVTVNQLQRGQLKPIILIDVRSPEEYAQDHIAQSLLVPLSDIEAGAGVRQIRALVPTSPSPRQSQPTLVLYCRSGQRAVTAYQYLQKTGLNFVVLDGGITAWRQAVPAAKDTQILTPITFPVR
jgi:rhodanese-related sulfurtransferase